MAIAPVFIRSYDGAWIQRPFWVLTPDSLTVALPVPFNSKVKEAQWVPSLPCKVKVLFTLEMVKRKLVLPGGWFASTLPS